MAFGNLLLPRRSFLFCFASLLLLQCFVQQVASFCHSYHRTAFRSSLSLLSRSRDARNNDADDASDNSNDNDAPPDMNPLTRASWYAVEAFGQVFGSQKNLSADGSQLSKGRGKIDFSRAPASLEEALERIKIDNDRSYFLSGEVDLMAYDEDCVFSDPFVSFKGRQRFVDNLANLGSFITNYSAKVLDYEVLNDGTRVSTRIMVKLELNLPWKPILAWPWGVTYDIDSETLLIYSHRESWDIEPLEGVKQIFRAPTVKISPP